MPCLLRNAAVLFTWLSAMILNSGWYILCARRASHRGSLGEENAQPHCRSMRRIQTAHGGAHEPGFQSQRAPLRAQVRNLHAKSSCGGPGYLVEEGTPLTLFVARWSSWRHNRGGPIGVLYPLRSISFQETNGGGRASARCRPWLPRLVAAHQPTPSRASTVRHGSGGGAHRRHRFGHRRPLLCVPAGAVRPAPWLHRVSHLPWPTATQRGSPRDAACRPAWCRSSAQFARGIRGPGGTALQPELHTHAPPRV